MRELVIRELEIVENADLRALLSQRLQQAAIENPHIETNPVRTVEQWCAYAEQFAHRMPWQTMDIGEDASFFRRIDQNIGYFYFLLGDLQYEPRVAQWLKEYNIEWGCFLSNPDSWKEEYYQLALADPLFELATNRYESPDNWHSWNDFFARRLNQSDIESIRQSIVNRQSSNRQFISPCDGVIASKGLIKTATIANWLDLLGDSPYRDTFAGGDTFHIVLDVFDYHRFHMPCDGTVLECKTIQGIHAGGGEIIWDEAENRYRYEQCGVTDFQMLETRGVLIIDTRAYGKIALVPVGVQQVSSVVWTHPVLTNRESLIDNRISQSEELGKFLFGGSDVVLFFEPGRAPHITPKSVKVGDPLIEFL